MSLPVILFPHNPLEPRKPDFDFEQEHRAAREAGFEVGILDTDRAELARPLPPGPALYRGWMVTADRYAQLVQSLSEVGLQMITSAEAYRFCHHLPQWYSALEGQTPESIWYPGALEWSPEGAAQRLGAEPLIVKDYVKSAKHYWHEACYIPSNGDLRRVTERFLELRGDDLEGGLVYRRFIPFQGIGKHPKSDMPLTLEYRAFFWKGQLLIHDHYWEAGDYPDAQPDWSAFADLLSKVQSPFYSLDVARDQEGRWWIMELGDGQVSGLPPGSDPDVFYRALASQLA